MAEQDKRGATVKLDMGQWLLLVVMVSAILGQTCNINDKLRDIRRDIDAMERQK